MWGCVLAHLSRYITQNCISVDQLTLNWKSGTHKQKYMLRCHCGTDVFQERFLDKVMGVKGGCAFYRRFYTRTETCEKGLYVCVHVFSV